MDVVYLALYLCKTQYIGRKIVPFWFQGLISKKSPENVFSDWTPLHWISIQDGGRMGLKWNESYLP